MNIVVVRSAAAWEDDACGESTPEAGTAATAQVVSDALSEEGHSVAVCTAETRLAAVLGRMPSRAAEGRASLMVFNLARRGSGDAGRAQVPALLDLTGVPYTGPTPLGHAVGFDLLMARSLLYQSGVAVAPCDVVRWPGHEPKLLQYPLVAAPRYQRPGGRRWVARSRRELSGALEEILNAGEQEAVVCEHFDSVELSCGLLGNGDDLELLPMIERHDSDPADPGHVAPIASTALGLQVGAMAAAAFKAVHCQDYARVLVRFDRRGRPIVAHVDSMPRIDRNSSLVFAADAGGYGHARLVSRILDTAHRRYFGTPAPRFDVTPARDSAQALRLIS